MSTACTQNGLLCSFLMWSSEYTLECKFIFLAFFFFLLTILQKRKIIHIKQLATVFWIFLQSLSVYICKIYEFLMGLAVITYSTHPCSQHPLQCELDVPLIKTQSLLPLLLNLCWPCDWLWPRDCSFCSFPLAMLPPSCEEAGPSFLAVRDHVDRERCTLHPAPNSRHVIDAIWDHPAPIKLSDDCNHMTDPRLGQPQHYAAAPSPNC